MRLFITSKYMIYKGVNYSQRESPMRLENEYQAVKFKKVKGAEFIPYTYFRGALEILLLVMITLLEEIKGWPSGEATQRDLTDLSLEELMSIEVTSVSKKEQNLFLTPAAVHVITEEDIRRSGATNIPEALRLVPGLSVAQVDTNKWAITSRGFNGLFASKLLVLIDGRSVYTPLFSGVYWDVQDTLLEDLDRIEVIRGPGATVWGANAVNGVINIITKRSEETQGSFISSGGGSQETGFAGLRYGGSVGEDLHYRIYTKYFNRGNFARSSGLEGADQWDVSRGGFRLDWKVSEKDSLTLHGDFYDGDMGQTLIFPTLSPPFTVVLDDRTQVVGGNLVGRWTRTVFDKSEIEVQTYYDRSERNGALLGEVRDLFDLELKHHWSRSEGHDVVWGFGYRVTSDELRNSIVVSLDPLSRTDHLFNGFLQDEITLAPDGLWLTVGSKFEHNSYTGWEIQPSAKLMWMPHHRHALWTGVSRAVRMPARTNSEFRINFAAYPDPTGLLTLISIFGNPDLSAEDLLAYELGYRFQPKSSLSFDVATFYNVYKDLMSTLWTTLASPAIRGWTPDWDGGRGARLSSVSFSKISSIPNIKNSVASSAA